MDGAARDRADIPGASFMFRATSLNVSCHFDPTKGAPYRGHPGTSLNASSRLIVHLVYPLMHTHVLTLLALPILHNRCTASWTSWIRSRPNSWQSCRCVRRVFGTPRADTVRAVVECGVVWCGAWHGAVGCDVWWRARALASGGAVRWHAAGWPCVDAAQAVSTHAWQQSRRAPWLGR
jgi:hypothetical protein